MESWARLGYVAYLITKVAFRLITYLSRPQAAELKIPNAAGNCHAPQEYREALQKLEEDLNRLKIIDLSHSRHLIKTPNLHSSSLEKLILKGCSSLVEVHQSIGHSMSLVFLNLEGCWSLKTLPESIGNVKSLETLNISGCSQLEKLPDGMGDMESLIELLADGIENEQFLSSIGQLKYVRRLSLRGYSSAPPSSSLISASVLNWKWWPPSFEWRSVNRLKLSYGSLSDRATNCVDFSGLSSLKELDLSENKFSSLSSGTGFLPKLGILIVSWCHNLVSIPDLPSSLDNLVACGCKSLERIRITIESKKKLRINLYDCHSLEEIQGIEGLSDIFWKIEVFNRRHSPKKLQKSFVEVLFLSVSLTQEETHNWHIH
ncbi:disease resistance protein RUN1-like [Populus nigra]|uniref:disease resistance protein RUN1-like n=1 Tax=Populus nigra TaxID=3691 RepID=UPI002B270D0B|nr:disease resistance protein RUN1-like [Populus nigra]